MSGENATLTAYGYGTYNLVVTHVSYALNIIGTEGEAANVKYFYTRQVQSDTFSIQAVFTTTAERAAFRQWYSGFAQQAITPSPVGAIRVQIPSRNFDMIGTLTKGVTETTTPHDVVWPMMLQFNGAQFNNSAQFANDPISSIYQTPPNDDTASKYFYPESTQLAGAPYYNPDVPPSSSSTPSGTNTSAVNKSVQSIINGVTSVVSAIGHW